jgi:hypothetical protein
MIFGDLNVLHLAAFDAIIAGPVRSDGILPLVIQMLDLALIHGHIGRVSNRGRHVFRSQTAEQPERICARRFQKNKQNLCGDCHT